MSVRDAYVEEVFQGFWAEIVCPNGEWDLEQVKRELCDFRDMMREVGLAYDEITNGKISKPNTRRENVIAAVEERIADKVQRGRADLISDLEDVLKAYKNP